MHNIHLTMLLMVERFIRNNGLDFLMTKNFIFNNIHYLVINNGE